MTASHRWVTTAVLLLATAVILFCIGWTTAPNVAFNGLDLLALMFAFGGMIIALVKGD